MKKQIFMKLAAWLSVTVLLLTGTLTSMAAEESDSSGSASEAYISEDSSEIKKGTMEESLQSADGEGTEESSAADSSGTSEPLLLYNGEESGEDLTDLEGIQMYSNTIPSVAYSTHVQTYGWKTEVSNGEESGTTGEAKRLEALTIRLVDAPYSGSIEYRTHVQSYGWMKWMPDGAVSGTTGEAKRLEAVQIRLTGEMAAHYDIYYRVHSQTFGWLGWAKNGEPAGTSGYAKRAESIQIVLIEKDGQAPGNTENAFHENLKVTYQTHVQTYGWQAEVSNGAESGTTGLAKRLEGIRIRLENHFLAGGSVEYKTHVQTFGWQDWVGEGEMSGTEGLAKRLEAIQIRLTGEMAEQYDIYYRVHCQTFGWTGWAKNGEPAGSEGLAKRLEAIQIVLVVKGGEVPGSTDNTYYKPQSWGVDVSSWQVAVNWYKAKADGVEYAMLRVTKKNTEDSGGTLMEDPWFKQNAMGALANGIPIGAYVYIYASTPEEARAEAEYAVSIMKGFNITYPVAFDLEEDEHMTAAAKLNNMAMMKEFCSVMAAAGYKTMVYGSPSKLQSAFDYSQVAASHDIWLARYRWNSSTEKEIMIFNNAATRKLVYDTGYEGGNYTDLSNVQMWQYTDSGRVSGISGNVDLDLCYKLY